MKPRLRSLIIALGGALAVAAPALAGPPGGSLFITDHEVNTTLPDWEKRLPKEAKDTLVKQVDGWKIFLVAYLNKAAGSEEVNLVFYPAGGLKSGEHPDAFPISTQAKAKILMSEVDISPVTGIKAGKYQIRLTRIIGGKEVIFAKGDVELLEPAPAAK